LRVGASAVILAAKEGGRAEYNGVAEVLKNHNTDIKIFNKPTTRPYRRMAVVLCNDNLTTDVNSVKEKAIRFSKQIEIVHS